MKLEDIESIARGLSVRTYIATVEPDGDPHVVPVHPAWVGNTIWIMTGTGSVKARNIGLRPSVSMHWEADESGDGLLVSGQATMHRDNETKERLWDGVFDYDLNLFAPDGPTSPEVSFIEVEPTKALWLKGYGAGGVDRWRA